jgi:hypothetical protein
MGTKRKTGPWKKHILFIQIKMFSF